MRNILILLAVLLVPIALLYSQGIPEWVSRYNGPVNMADQAKAIAVDNSGNVYVAGYSKGSGTDFDYLTIKYNGNTGGQEWVQRYNGPGNSTDQANAIAVYESGSDVYVYVTGQSMGDGTKGYEIATIKYDGANGNVMWGQLWNYDVVTNGNDAAYAIAVDASGNVYVTGMSDRASYLGTDYATIKYNSSGVEQWVSYYTGPWGGECARAIALDAYGNVYVTGESNGFGTSGDYATVKYNTSGNEIWAKRYTGPGQGGDCARAISVDISGNTYVTGSSWGGSGTNLDYVTIKYTPDGDTARALGGWFARYNGPASFNDEAYAIAVDASGNAYVTGYCTWTMTYPGRHHDYMTIKYNSNGDMLWNREYNGTGNSLDYANAITLDAACNVYVTGQSTGSGTGYDYVTIKYNSNGIEQGVTRYNGSGNGDDVATAIAVDNVGNIYVTGYSQGSGTSYDYATIKYVHGSISGTKFNDINGNGIKDPGELGVGQWTIFLDPISSFTKTDNDGNYSFAFLPPNTYTVSEECKNFWQQTYPTPPGTHTVNLGWGQSVTGKDFGNQPTANVQDLAVSIAGSQAQVGFKKRLVITYGNLGTVPVNNNDSIVLHYPMQTTLDYGNWSKTPDFISEMEHILIWRNLELGIGDKKDDIWVILNDIPNLLNTILISEVWIYPIVGDVTPADNYDFEEEPIRGAVDPNEKQVTPEGSILLSDTLVYTIQFQNVGTAPAFNVIVIDTLDTDLDWSTIQFGASSHPYILSGNTESRFLKWEFRNINLPDSHANQLGSHGFFKFKVRPLSNLPPGREITNTAAIYFDFNPPVITNTVTNTIGVKPGEFELTTPVNGAVNRLINDTLFWRAAARTESYDVTLGSNTFNTTDTFYNYSNLNYSTTYSWDVTAKNLSGNTASTNGPFSFTTIVEKPAAFNLTGPTKGATGVAIEGDLTWTASDRATEYEVTLGGETHTVTTNSYPYSGLSYSTLYTWNVKAINDGGYTMSTSGPFTFKTIKERPAAPVLSSPDNGAVKVLIDGSLSWEEASRAEHYDVYLGTDPENLPKVADDLEALSYVYTGLSYFTDYYWMVVAENEGGADTSAVWSFKTIKEKPGAFDLTSPANGSTGLAIEGDLTWTASDRVDHYEVTLDGKTYEVSTNSYHYSDLSYFTEYTWNVKAINDGGYTMSTSGPFTFTTIIEKPGAFDLTSPANGSNGLALEGDLTWTASDRASSYEVTLGSNTYTVTTNSYHYSGLSYFTDYSWNVKAINDGGDIISANGPFTFTTIVEKPAAFNLTDPIINATGVVIEGNLMWEASNRATSYEVTLGSNTYTVLTNSYPYSGLSYSTPYTWNVKAINDGGDIISANGPFTFTTIVEKPAAFNLTAPLDDAVNMPIEGDLTWEVSTRATSYEVTLGSNTYTVTTNSYHYSGLDYLTGYSWNVKAINVGGSTISTNGPFSFITIIEQPGSFALLTPAKNAEDVTIDGDLTWESSTCADYYEVTLGSNTYTVTTNYYHYNSLSYLTPYNWNVTACNDGGSIASTNGPFNFTTIIEKPGAFNLTSPTNGATGVAIEGDLTWEVSNRATSYEVILGGETHTVTTNSYHYSGLSNLTLYTWDVKAINDGGYTMSNQPFTFTTIIEKPGAFDLTSPANGATDVPIEGYLTWKTSVRADFYKLTLDGNTHTVSGTSYPYSFDYKTDHTWNVEAVNDNCGTMSSNGPCSFTIGYFDVNPIIYQPDGNVFIGQEVIPTVEIENNGTFTPENFWVKFEIWDSATSGNIVHYQDEKYVGIFNPNDPYIYFTTWTAPDFESRFYMKCTTKLTNDYYPTNDKVSGNFKIVPEQPGSPNWVQRAPVPAGPLNREVQHGGGMASDELGDSIYLLKGNNTCEFYLFTPNGSGNGTWSSLVSIPELGRDNIPRTVKEGGTIAQINGKYYVTKGGNTREFWKYDPYPEGQDPHWTQLADVPAGATGLHSGTSAVGATDNGISYIYLLRASETFEFYRYNISTGLWETMSSAPGVVGEEFKKGSAITYDGADTIYALKGIVNKFYAYVVSTNTWIAEPKPSLPFGSNNKAAKGGADILYQNRKVYCVKGSNSQEFWVYKCDSTLWRQSDDVWLGQNKIRVQDGAGLAYSYRYRYLYLTKGMSFEFLSYGQLSNYIAGLTPQEKMNENAQGTENGLVINYELKALPNVCHDFARISYALPKSGNVTLKLYDATGREIRILAQGKYEPGRYDINYNTRTLAQGIYYLKYEAANYCEIKKLMVLR
jgi:uncharacterized delta-60 repeat protein